MPTIATKTSYLEMFQPPSGEVAPPRCDVQVQRIEHPSNDVYRHLYSSVGAKLHWVDRLVMPDAQLRAILDDARVEIFVLRVAGQTAGYSELDCRDGSDIELAYFGLVPEFIGQGLGRYFLDWTVRTAWLHRPARLWVHTCDLDHPAALPLYLKAGFKIYNQVMHDQFVPEALSDKHSRGED